MSKAIIVADFAYKGPKRTGRGSGHQGLRNLLGYLQYRDRVQNQLAKQPDYERWQDHGLGVHWREIFQQCDELQSKHVLAWTWVISPAPDLMALVPEDQRRDLVCDLTERVVEEYYEQRGFDTPPYSYILHDRQTNEAGMQQLHTHVILPGMAPLPGVDMAPVYNNKERGDDVLFREIAAQNFSDALDRIVGPEWRLMREQEPERTPDTNDLDVWFPRER
jgi:hypothetical protein